MPEQITVSGCGKINLTLAVAGRRGDGYHTLSSVMQSISLCDTVTVRKTARPGVTLLCGDPSLPVGAENTAFRAAEAFLSAVADAGGVSIELVKRIPYQAGLGSASADAAATLAALGRLFKNPPDPVSMTALAQSVGADVPFCLTGGTQLAEGFGEILTPLPPLPACFILLVKPAQGMSTPQAYRRFDELDRPRQPDAARMTEALRRRNLREIGACCGNVFEQCCPVADVFEIKAGLFAAGALGASMSGSGTAVFGLFETQRQAQMAAVALAASGRGIWIAQPTAQGVTTE